MIYTEIGNLEQMKPVSGSDSGGTQSKRSQFRNHGKLSHLELRTTFNFILCTVRKNTCLCYCKNSLNKITF